MAQHDYVIANQGFPAFRSDLNDALAAVVSNNSGATEPTTMFAHQVWVDTAANPSVLKIRNADNDAWITIGSIDQTGDTFTLTSIVSTTSPAVISVDSSSDALRITQVGTGNALVVEDDTNPDASPFVIDANGRVLNGSTTSYNLPYPATDTQTAANFQQHGTSTSTATAGITSWATGTQASGALVLAHSRSGTVGTPGVLEDGNSIGFVSFAGDDGTNFIQAASIEAEVDGTPGTDDMPGRLRFSTTADGASTPTERVRIASDGQVTLSADAGLTISKTNVTAPASTDGNVYSGTYTPTLTNSTNISSSSAGVAQYMRVGNVVTVSGQIDIDPTAGTSDTILRMSLPVATNILGQTNAGGTFYVLSGVVSWGGSIYGDSANEGVIFRMYPGDGANRAYQFTFTYQVI